MQVPCVSTVVPGAADRGGMAGTTCLPPLDPVHVLLYHFARETAALRGYAEWHYTRGEGLEPDDWAALPPVLCATLLRVYSLGIRLKTVFGGSRLDAVCEAGWAVYEHLRREWPNPERLARLAEVERCGGEDEAFVADLRARKMAGGAVRPAVWAAYERERAALADDLPPGYREAYDLGRLLARGAFDCMGGCFPRAGRLALAAEFRSVAEHLGRIDAERTVTAGRLRIPEGEVLSDRLLARVDEEVVRCFRDLGLEPAFDDLAPLATTVGDLDGGTRDRLFVAPKPIPVPPTVLVLNAAGAVQPDVRPDAEPVKPKAKRGGGRRAFDASGPTSAKHVARLNLYELVRLVRKQGHGPKALAKHFKSDNAFIDRARGAGIKVDVAFFRAACEWLRHHQKSDNSRS